MKKSIKAGIAVLAMLSTAQTALAGEGCVRHKDMLPLRVAALQQQLMVAALSCHAVPLYNRFVISYRRQLQVSDNALKAFFIKHGSIAQYHAFKTRLANNSSLTSIGDTDSYCRDAYAEFDEALAPGRHNLRGLVVRFRVPADSTYPDCDEVRSAWR